MKSWSLMTLLVVVIVTTTSEHIQLSITSTADSDEFIDVSPINSNTLEIGAENLRNPNFNKTYKMGGRKHGDVLVGQLIWRNSFHETQNLTYHLRYPKEGERGAELTSMVITTNQASNIGIAILDNGGVRKRRASFTLQANKTMWIDIDVLFYGFK